MCKQAGLHFRYIFFFFFWHFHTPKTLNLYAVFRVFITDFPPNYIEICHFLFIPHVWLAFLNYVMARSKLNQNRSDWKEICPTFMTFMVLIDQHRHNNKPTALIFTQSCLMTLDLIEIKLNSKRVMSKSGHSSLTKCQSCDVPTTDTTASTTLFSWKVIRTPTQSNFPFVKLYI